MKKHHRLLLFVISLCSVSSIVFASDHKLSAYEVMLLVDNRYEGSTQKREGSMVLIDKKKRKRIKTFVEFLKKYGDDEKSISYILSPSEVRNTAFLSYEWKDRNRSDESWLYLPQLKKVKRLASNDKSSYFLGSDFTYADLIGLEVEDFDYEFVNNEDDNEYWVIMANPKMKIREKVVDETGYKRVKYWVSKEKKLIEKAQYWLDEGDKVKYFSASEIKKIDDIWTIKKRQMVLTQGGKYLHASVYQSDRVQYNLILNDETFTTYAMERHLQKNNVQ
jgi:hypothetical protein